MLPLLFAEIGHALVVGNMEEVPVLRLELYGASMQKCQNDLQQWISYLAERTEKLGFLGHKVPEEELVAIFLKGLHPVFQQLQVYFSIPGNMPTTLDKATTIVRKFAATPVLTAELAKLRAPGVSQNMFAAHTEPQPKQQSCKNYARTGSCKYGSSCKFTHHETPTPPVQGIFAKRVPQEQHQY